MQATIEGVSGQRTLLWTGVAMSALAILFLLFDAAIHIMQIAPVVESFGELGYPASLALGLGMIELACIVLYLVPRTSVLGVILLTAYLGGAIASHVRIESPLFSHVLFPLYLGLLLWGGLYLREPRLRSLIPLRR